MPNNGNEVSVDWKPWWGWRIAEVLDESDEIIGGSGQREVYVTEILKRLQLLAMQVLGYDHWSQSRREGRTIEGKKSQKVRGQGVGNIIWMSLEINREKAGVMFE